MRTQSALNLRRLIDRVELRPATQRAAAILKTRRRCRRLARQPLRSRCNSISRRWIHSERSLCGSRTRAGSNYRKRRRPRPLFHSSPLPPPPSDARTGDATEAPRASRQSSSIWRRISKRQVSSRSARVASLETAVWQAPNVFEPTSSLTHRSPASQTAASDSRPHRPPAVALRAGLLPPRRCRRHRLSKPSSRRKRAAGDKSAGSAAWAMTSNRWPGGAVWPPPSSKRSMALGLACPQLWRLHWMGSHSRGAGCCCGVWSTLWSLRALESVCSNPQRSLTGRAKAAAINRGRPAETSRAIAFISARQLPRGSASAWPAGKQFVI